MDCTRAPSGKAAEVTSPMVLSRPIGVGGERIPVPTPAQPPQGYHLSWEHGPQGSSPVYVGSPIETSGSVTDTWPGSAERLRLVAGYLKLAAQSQSDDEKVIDADRRARRDRNRTLRAL